MGRPSPSSAPASAELLAELIAALGDATEARWVLAAAAGRGAEGGLGRGNEPVPEATAASARAMASRRLAGEPLQYVLGTWAFRSLEVVVDDRVLVPRPETEQVVGAALGELTRVAMATSAPILAADLGTGSGVIALSLAAEGPPSLEVWAVDSSAAALEVAGANLAALGRTAPQRAARVHLVAGSWFEALPSPLAGRLDLVVSNPPYVSTVEWETLDPVVRDHEPRAALVAGDNGREALELLLGTAPRWLAPGGALVLELAPHQADMLADNARVLGYDSVRVLPDLAGRLRTLVARRPGAPEATDAIDATGVRS